MPVTNADILTYVLTNRLHLEDGEYLLQEKVETMGQDAVSSAFTWIWGRFFHAGRSDILTLWKAAVYDSVDPVDLESLDTLRARFVTNDISTELIDMYVMLFDSVAQLAVANIWQASNMEDEGESRKKEAQQLISAIIGNDATPLAGQDGGGGNQDMEQFGDAVVCVDAATATEIKTELGGFE